MSLKIVMSPTQGAVGDLRMRGPAACLIERGHHVGLVGAKSDLTEAQQAALMADADVVAVHVASGVRAWEDRHPAFRAIRGALVGEIDDNEWAWGDDPVSREPEAAALMEGRGTPEALARLESWLRNVDLVTTTTERLAAVLRERGAREVAVCPNAVSIGMGRRRPRTSLEIGGGLSPARALLARSQRAREQVPPFARAHPHGRRVGWTGSIAHKADLAPALAALRRLALVDGLLEVRSLGPVDFRSMPEWLGAAIHYDRLLSVFDEETGSLHLATERALARSEVPGVAYPSVPHGIYYSALEAMCPDVAVIPLRPSPFNLCKSDCTLLAWSIQGVPVVCSRVGPYAEAEAAGLPAIYVEHDDADAWTDALQGLLHDRQRATELGERARSWVLQHRAFPKAADPWEAAYQRAAASKSSRAS